MLGTLRSPTSPHSPTACATAWSRYYVLSEALTWRSRAYEVLFQALMWRQRAYDVSRDGTAAGSTCDGLPPRKQGTRHAVNNFQARPMDALQNRFSKAFGGVSKSRQPRKPLSTPPAHLYAQVVKGALTFSLIRYFVLAKFMRIHNKLMERQNQLVHTAL